MAATIPKTVMAMMTTPAGQSAIEAATKRNSRVFAAYIVLLLATALLVAFFTWLTWDSGNKVQDAVQAEANARIEEAKAAAAEANQKAEEERLARVKIEERLAWRRILGKQRAEFVSKLKPFAGTTIMVSNLTDPESRAFAIDIVEMLREAGWNAILVPPKLVSKPPIGVECVIDSSKPASFALRAVMQALGAVISPTQLSDSNQIGAIIVGLRPPQ